MNEHYQRIASIAEDLIYGLRRDKEAKISRLPTGKRSKAAYVPDADRRRKALRLVEECAEYECPPPQQVIEALRLAFMDSERQPINTRSIAEEFSVRLMAGEAGIEPKSWHAFRVAAAAEARNCEVGTNGEVAFRASVRSVAKAAGVETKSIRQWRANPSYRREVEVESQQRWESE